MTDNLPWHREEIFHDEIDRYPLVDFFPLQAKPSASDREVKASAQDQPEK